MRNSGGLKKGSVRTPEMFESSSRQQNSARADSTKSTLETEDHVPRAEHIDPYNVALHQG
jgi:hypothetical protein